MATKTVLIVAVFSLSLFVGGLPSFSQESLHDADTSAAAGTARLFAQSTEEQVDPEDKSFFEMPIVR